MITLSSLDQSKNCWCKSIVVKIIQMYNSGMFVSQNIQAFIFSFIKTDVFQLAADLHQ